MFNRILRATALAFIVLVSCGVSSSYAEPRTDNLPPKDQSRHPAYVGKKSEISGSVLSIAKRYLGTNPTKMRRLWCHAFANMVLKKAGKQGSGSNFARSGLKVGRPVSLAAARPGDLVVLSRGKGGHSGFYLGRTANGRIQLISGNTRGRVVGISAYAPGRVLGIRRLS